MQTKQWIPGALVLAVVAVLLGASAATAGKGSADTGRSLYRSYCASCHGDTGTGDGVIAEGLEPPPADLTRIAERNGGTFPADTVRQIIDGRQPLKGHVRSEMPVWGAAFEIAEPQADEASVASKIDDLTAFLASIQVKPKAEPKR
jgi:mono/diheme cytochrome c family protein